AGINAIGVIDTRQYKVLGHLPAGWFPSRVALHDDDVWVTNVNGQGTGPNIDRGFPGADTFLGSFRRGTMSTFALPGVAELPAATRTVMEMSGLKSREGAAA